MSAPASASATGAATAGAGLEAAAGFVTFVNASPSPFHAVAEAEARLTKAGFTKLSERDVWVDTVKPNGRYFVTRNQSALVAFTVGGKFTPGNGFSIVGAHTDSPCLKLKPISTRAAAGCLTVGVECYGGGLWYTWFDRDLSVAGRVIVKQADGTFGSKLVRIDRPLMRVPTLAIHLDRSVNDQGFQYNKETHLAPILELEVKKQVDGAAAAAAPGAHHATLLRLLGEELSVAPEDILSLDLCLYDTQPSTLAGPASEFIYSARLDNLMMSYTAIEGLIGSLGSEGDDSYVRTVALFDNEEVGSDSLMGAGSTLLEEVMKRVTNSGAGTELFSVACRNSFLVSADMAHAVHPNYAGKHEEKHAPKMNKGVVVKTNANQRYATSPVSSFLLKQIAERAGVPIQEFAIRQDSVCGSTIGPILSTSLGMRTVDVGIPQLSMHSIREMCGSADVGSAVTLFTTYFNDFAAVDSSLGSMD